jgi:hypothetical protein
MLFTKEISELVKQEVDQVFTGRHWMSVREQLQRTGIHIQPKRNQLEVCWNLGDKRGAVQDFIPIG